MQKARATVGSRENVIGWKPLLYETSFGEKEKDQRYPWIAPQTRNRKSQHSISMSINLFHENQLYVE